LSELVFLTEESWPAPKLALQKIWKEKVLSGVSVEVVLWVVPLSEGQARPKEVVG